MNEPTVKPIGKCDQERLDQFLDADGYKIEDQALTMHLDSCGNCRDYLESAAANKEVWNRAQSLLQPDEFDKASDAYFSAATLSGHGAHCPTAIKDVLDGLAPTDAPNSMGRIGTYEVTGVVGVGGMGVVLKAIDPSLDRVVAIKVMAPRLANNDKARKRFAREAKAAAAVLHPNVVPIHSVSSDDSLPYLVMAYVRGGSLQKRLKDDGPLKLVEVLRIGSQVAAGLAAAHEQGLIHRDIKPENILLEEGVERVTITDFGLARAVDDNTVTQLGSIAGTPQYMSPEQARGESLDQTTDLFSLGSVLYELSTGRPPFISDSSFGVMRRIIDEPAVPLVDVNPELPQWLSDIVAKLMAKDKSERFENAVEVQQLLERCLSHVQQPAANPLPSHLQTKRRTLTRKRNMKIIFTCLAAIVSMLAIGIGMKWHSLALIVDKQNAQHVYMPLSEVDSVVASMMNSPNKMVFFNISDIGEDKNYLCFEPIDGGVSIRFPAFTESSWSRRQGKNATKLKEVASSLSLTISEKSELRNDGSVEGVNFLCQVTGDPKFVAETIKKFTVRTFQINESDICKFQYVNMPKVFGVKEGEQPTTVSAAEFIAEVERGERVYLGEQASRIFLAPKDRIMEQSIQWNDEIWSTDVRQLPPDDLHKIRRSGSAKGKPKQASN